MRIIFGNSVVIVTRELGDPAYHGIKNGAGESLFLYAVKKQLNTEGYDLIKKRMWKDGHLVDNMQQYLRSRKPSGNPEKDIAIYNTFWAKRGANEDFNDGQVILGLNTHIFE